MRQDKEERPVRFCQALEPPPAPQLSALTTVCNNVRPDWAAGREERTNPELPVPPKSLWCGRSHHPHPSIGPDAADETCPPRCQSLPAASPMCPTSVPAINSLTIFNSCLPPSVQGELAFKLRCFWEVNHASAGAAVPAGTHGAPRGWRNVPVCTVLSTIPSTHPRTEPQNPLWGWERLGPPLPALPAPLLPQGWGCVVVKSPAL